MAIKLLGIKKYIPTKSATTEAIRMAENYIKTHTDEEGKISDPQVYYEAIGVLAPFGDDLRIANKIADYKNKALKLENKIEEAENDRILFKSRLKTAIMEATKENIEDPRGLIFKLATTYGRALEEYEEKILGEAFKNLPKGQKIPQSLLDDFDELDKQTRFLMDLSNSYVTVDPVTELAGPANPDAYGVLVKTNPQTGAIVNLDIQEITSLDKAPSGYVRTDSRFGRIPIYLNFYDEAGKTYGRLGNFKFSGDKEEYTSVAGEVKERTVLKGEGDILGGFEAFIERQIRKIGKETGKGILQEQQEFPLSSIPFDFFQIPAESVVVDNRGDYFFLDRSMILWRAENKEILKRFLRENGKDPELEVEGKPYLAHPDFITQYYKVDENGKSNLIDESFFGGVIKKEEPRIDLSPSISEGVKTGPSVYFGWTPGSRLLERFLKPRLKKEVKPSPEYTPRGYEVPKILRKGEEIFKGAKKGIEKYFK